MKNSEGGLKGAFWQSKALKETFNVNLNKISICHSKEKNHKIFESVTPTTHIAPMKDTQRHIGRQTR